jgi:hypothetical protein
VPRQDHIPRLRILCQEADDVQGFQVIVLQLLP